MRTGVSVLGLEIVGAGKAGFVLASWIGFTVSFGSAGMTGGVTGLVAGWGFLVEGLLLICTPPGVCGLVCPNCLISTGTTEVVGAVGLAGWTGGFVAGGVTAGIGPFG